MSDSLIPVSSASGVPLTLLYNLDGELVTVAGNPVLRERMQVAGAAPLEIARVMNTTPGAGTYGLVVRGQGWADAAGVEMTLAGALKVTLLGSTDGAAFNEGASQVVVVGGEYNEGSPLLAPGSTGAAARLTAARALHMNLRDAIGNAVAIKNVVPLLTDYGLATRVLTGLADAVTLSVTEKGAAGTPSEAQVTVDAVTANGVQIVAPNTARRRVTITNLSTTDVWLRSANLTAGGATLGDLLLGTKGYLKTYFHQGQIRATCAGGTALVSVAEEVVG